MRHDNLVVALLGVLFLLYLADTGKLGKIRAYWSATPQLADIQGGGSGGGGGATGSWNGTGEMQGPIGSGGSSTQPVSPSVTTPSIGGITVVPIGGKS